MDGHRRAGGDLVLQTSSPLELVNASEAKAAVGSLEHPPSVAEGRKLVRRWTLMISLIRKRRRRISGSNSISSSFRWGPKDAAVGTREQHKESRSEYYIYHYLNTLSLFLRGSCQIEFRRDIDVLRSQRDEDAVTDHLGVKLRICTCPEILRWVDFTHRNILPGRICLLKHLRRCY